MLLGRRPLRRNFAHDFFNQESVFWLDLVLRIKLLDDAGFMNLNPKSEVLSLERIERRPNSGRRTIPKTRKLPRVRKERRFDTAGDRSTNFCLSLLIEFTAVQEVSIRNCGEFQDFRLQDFRTLDFRLLHFFFPQPLASTNASSSTLVLSAGSRILNLAR